MKLKRIALASKVIYWHGKEMNSQNIINALIEGNSLGMKTFAVLAFDGGKCRKLASKSIYFKINDMQIAEDTQLIVFHMCMQWLSNPLNFQNS